MQLYPAIDIKDGKCVRLEQGRFDKVTVFSDNPSHIAAGFEDCGATYIHIVDLDGARCGSAYNNHVIKNILDAVNVPVQVGGGIRSMEDVEQKLAMGVRRVILGTAAINNKEFVKKALSLYGDRIVIGVDAKDGMAAAEGWEQTSEITAVDLCKEMKELGAKTIIYTDIAKDGMMCGPNVSATKELADAVGLEVIASGGVSCMDDLESVKNASIKGVILGKSLYKGAIDLKEAIRLYQR